MHGHVGRILSSHRHRCTSTWSSPLRQVPTGKQLRQSSGACRSGDGSGDAHRAGDGSSSGEAARSEGALPSRRNSVVTQSQPRVVRSSATSLFLPREHFPLCATAAAVARRARRCSSSSSARKGPSVVVLHGRSEWKVQSGLRRCICWTCPWPASTW